MIKSKSVGKSFVLLLATLCCISAQHQSAIDTPNEIVQVRLFERENAQTHHTLSYDLVKQSGHNAESPLVIRRGDPFTIQLHFKRPYDVRRDQLRFEFLFGRQPQLVVGTLIYLPLSSNATFSRSKSKWESRTLSTDGVTLTVQIRAPSQVAVGVWKMRISTRNVGQKRIATFAVPNPIYVLFNPWSSDDTVHLKDESARQEFVLNDVGKIYLGSHSRANGRKWVYGQFDKAVLPAVMFLLEKSNLDHRGRANAVQVVRAVAALVNSHDENGVLVSNWNGTYVNGTAPFDWTGSAAILAKYHQTNGYPVMYGQCWVYAGLTTTVCRALGNLPWLCFHYKV
jgi:transglutaminase 1